MFSTGDITVGDITTVIPFGNTVDTITIKGMFILEALEHSVAKYSEVEPGGEFLQVSGRLLGNVHWAKCLPPNSALYAITRSPPTCKRRISPLTCEIRLPQAQNSLLLKRRCCAYGKQSHEFGPWSRHPHRYRGTGRTGSMISLDTMISFDTRHQVSLV